MDIEKKWSAKKNKKKFLAYLEYQPPPCLHQLERSRTRNSHFLPPNSTTAKAFPPVKKKVKGKTFLL
jgi:hypothetical protein